VRGRPRRVRATAGAPSRWSRPSKAETRAASITSVFEGPDQEPDEPPRRWPTTWTPGSWRGPHHVDARATRLDPRACARGRKVLAPATDPGSTWSARRGSSRLSLIWALEHDVIDAALDIRPWRGTAPTWKALPAVARTARTSSPPPARATRTRPTGWLRRGDEGGAERIALVGMGCQSSARRCAARKAGKIARRFALSVGAPCSKTFDRRDLPELFGGPLRAPPPQRSRTQSNEHQRRVQVWMHDGSYHEIPLQRGARFTVRVQVVPGLRPPRPRRHLDRWHRCVHRTGRSPSCAPSRAAEVFHRHGAADDGRRDPPSSYDDPGAIGCCAS